MLKLYSNSGYIKAFPSTDRISPNIEGGVGYEAWNIFLTTESCLIILGGFTNTVHIFSFNSLKHFIIIKFVFSI